MGGGALCARSPVGHHRTARVVHAQGWPGLRRRLRVASSCFLLPVSRLQAEDDGWVLALVYDSAKDRTRLVILDAHDLAGDCLPLCRRCQAAVCCSPRVLGGRRARIPCVVLPGHGRMCLAASWWHAPPRSMCSGPGGDDQAAAHAAVWPARQLDRSLPGTAARTGEQRGTSWDTCCKPAAGAEDNHGKSPVHRRCQQTLAWAPSLTSPTTCHSCSRSSLRCMISGREWSLSTPHKTEMHSAVLSVESGIPERTRFASPKLTFNYNILSQ